MGNMNIEKLLRYSADLICTIDEEGRFATVSDAVATILGYLPEELAGRSYTEFIFPDDLESSLNAAREVVTEPAVLRFQNRYLHKDGHSVPLSWTARWDPEDRLIYCIARDGQATKQAESWRLSLEESNTRYKYVTKATVDAIWDWDMEKGTLYWGEGFESIFGYKLRKLSPDISSWTDHIHPEDKDRVLNSINVVIKGGYTNWKDEYRYQKADGSFAFVVDRGFVIRNAKGKAVRMVGAMHDITERKTALQELKRFADDLCKRNRDLHQFGYVVSHNLRAPVANIMGIATLMEMEQDNPDILKKCTRDLKTSITRLDEVIQDLSKILTLNEARNEMNEEWIDLTEVLNNVCTDLQSSLVSSGMKVKMPQASFVFRSHKAYVYSIFFNLISNAIKYRSEGNPEIDIRVRNDEKFLEVEIADNGIGIDLPRHQDELFKPYKRFHFSKEGKGLGLFLVKSHVEALNGQIAIRSTPGAGTCFTIRLPFSPSDAGAA